jgi:hypothetical protein
MPSAKPSIGSFVLTTLVTISAPAARAAEWFRLPGAEFNQRQAVTVENTTDVPTDAALVHIPLADLQKTLPDAKANQLAVVEPGTKPSARDRADENFVPFQVNHGVLRFAIPLKAHEKKQLYIYTAPQRVIMPGFPPKTAYDNRHAYRSFENNLMAFRVETGPGANTTGMGIDLFGKTKQGKGLRLQEAYEHGHDSYHKLAFWGMDVLKVGSSPALGGVYVVVGDQMGRPDFATEWVDLVHQGPVETCVRITGPVEAGGRKFTVTRTLTLWGEERGIDDVVEIKGSNLDGVQLGVGLRNLPNEQWVEKTSDGYALVNGDNNQPGGYTSQGLGVAFPASQYVKTFDLPDKENGGHVYILNPKKGNDALTSHHHLAAIWNGDGQINNVPDFEKYLQTCTKLLDQPAKVDLSAPAEKQP